MTTMAENGVLPSPHDVIGTQLTSSNSCLALPETPSPPPVKQTTAPLFSQPLMTVEQLTGVTVDADIQTSVDEFLKGLTTQMFARIVRNGSAEVGRWLGAKIQGERDGWTAMLKMAMEEIESHRKAALQGQVLLQETLEQLQMLVGCFRLNDDSEREITSQEDAAKGIQLCVQVLAECCNALMEDRFRCVDLLDLPDPPPDSLATAVNAMKDKVAELESERDALKNQFTESKAENSKLDQQSKTLFEELQKMEDKVKSKQEDLLNLKTQLREIDNLVNFRRDNLVDKCVGTTALDFLKPTASKQPHERSVTLTARAPHPHTPLAKAAGDVSLTARENMYTQTLKEPSFIELSEEKLRVLKERARKLESSLHGAIASMDKLRKAAPAGDRRKPSSSSSASSAMTSATFVALPSHRSHHPREPPKWLSSFEVTNSTTASVTASVPKLGHFKPTERRCFSERPPGKASDEQSDARLSSDSRAKPDPRRASKTRSGQVSKCLRCQKLFTTTDNHKLACCFHSKGKERMEVYSDGGQLVKVRYVWKCCHQQGESDGCCYGHHV